VDAARGAALQAGARDDPELQWSEEAEDATSFGNRTLGISQLVEFPGKRSLRRRVGMDQVRIEASTVESLRRQARGAVAGPFYAIARESAAIGTLEKIDSLLVRLGDITRTRFETGRGTYSEVLRVRVEQARLATQIADARSRRTEDEVQLDLLLGRPVETPVTLASGILTFTPLERSLDEVLAERTAANHTLEAARTGVERQEGRLSLAHKTNLPDFQIGASLQMTRTPQSSGDFLAAELGASVPLWRTRQRGAERQAEAELRGARITLDRRTAAVRTDVATAYQRTAAAARRVQALEESVLPDLRAALEAAVRSYGLGSEDLLVVLDLVRTAGEVRVEHDTALADYLTSRARMDVSGELLGGM